MDGGFVADGQLVVAGGHGPVALEPGDAAFHGMAGLVVFGVEGGRAAAGAALCPAVAGPIGFLRNGAPDPAAPQVSAVGAGPAGLAGAYLPGPGAGPAAARAGDADALQDGPELRAVAPLPCGDDHRERLLALLAGQVDLGG